MPKLEFKHHVVLIDYDEILFSPMGFEADLLAETGASWRAFQCVTEHQALDAARQADVTVIQTVRPLLTRSVIDKLERCRGIIRAGAGYDSVNVRAATERGIMVCNAPTYCTDDVADHAVALLFASVRHVARLDAAMRRARFARELAIPTRRIEGSTLGIIGLGRIGGTVARRVRGWDLTVLAYDPYVDRKHSDALGAQLVSLDELLQRSDFISVHCPLTEETHHLLSWKEFAAAKPGLVLVNTARGAIVHEDALVEALRGGRVWAAGLDVFEQEPLPPDSPLFALDNAILTPHISANSPEARRDLYRQVCEISVEIVQGRVPPFLVNPEVLGDMYPTL